MRVLSKGYRHKPEQANHDRYQRHNRQKDPDNDQRLAKEKNQKADQ